MSEVISSIAYGDADMLESVTEMRMNTLAESDLDQRTYMMVRIAALVATDAPSEAYAISLSGTSEEMEVDDLEAILVALAPVVGAARIASAASNILDTFFDTEAEAEETAAAESVADGEPATEIHVADTPEDAVAETATDAVAEDAPTDAAAATAADAVAEDSEADLGTIRIFDARTELIEIEDLAEHSEFEDASELDHLESAKAGEFETV